MTDGPRILICDDEPGIRKTLSQILDDEGYTVDAVGLGQDALQRAFSEDGPRPEAILLDVWLPDVDGLTVLDRLRAGGLEIPVVMISGHGTVDTAVQAVKRGADDFLEKPLSLERVLLTLDKVLERHRLAKERDALKRELLSRTGDDAAQETLLGTGAAMRRLLDEIARAGASEARVLITGESGVGKELVARALHRASPRAAGPFVEVNGAAIPEELIESELFGHMKGSFTGAIEDRKGKWEQADGGTLFLDEIGDISPKLQLDLLRVLEERRVTRVGGTESIPVDVRIIAATNRDLQKAIAEGRFREDLFYRLNVITLTLAPLRDRKEDIPLLVDILLEQLAVEMKKPVEGVSPEGMALLLAHSWPGNVRELRNVLERGVVVSTGPLLLPGDLGLTLRGEEIPSHPASLAEIERQHIAAVLRNTGGNVSQAARILDIDRVTLYSKIHKFGLKRADDGVFEPD